MSGQFMQQTIERFFDEHQVQYVVGEEGAYYASFSGGELPDHWIQLCGQGSDGDVLSIRICTDHSYPNMMRDNVETFVEDWNRETLWPTAYCSGETSPGLMVGGVNTYPLLADTHWAAVRLLIENSLSGGHQMLAEMVRVLGTPGLR